MAEIIRRVDADRYRFAADWSAYNPASGLEVRLDSALRVSGAGREVALTVAGFGHPNAKNRPSEASWREGRSVSTGALLPDGKCSRRAEAEIGGLVH